MSQTIANYSAILKEYYNPDRVAKMILSSSPLVAMVPKKQIFGSSWELPIIYAGTGGRSATFSTALANKGQTASTKFQITTSQDYALASVDRKVMLTSQSNLGAFLPAAKTNIDAAITQLRRSIAINVYRNGSGSRGAIASFTAGPPSVITLTNQAAAVNFQVGDVLILSAVRVGGTPRTGTVTVSGIDRSAGTITVAEALGTAISGASDGDWIFCEGDYNDVMTGLEGWLPDTAPGATPFFGVNRSIDADMLGGIRFDGSGSLRYEALIEAQSQIAALGDGRPTHAFCNSADYRAVILELDAQVRRYRDADVSVPVRRGTNAAVGFNGVVVNGDAGEFQLFPDRFCPTGLCYILQLEDWKMCHIGPELVDLVGRESDEGMLVETTQDGYEVRITSYPQLACSAPGHSGVIYNFGA